jgi:hypothetical protein
MALKTVQPDAETRFGLEDVFVGGGASTLAWVSGWRKLPHLKRDVETLFDYPQRFAEEIFDRIEQALRRHVSRGETNAGVHTGQLFVLAEGDLHDSKASLIPDLPVRYIRSSDKPLVAAGKAEYQDDAQLASDRREARCLLSYKTPAGWAAISKAVITEILGEGRDAKVAGLPPVAVDALKLMCPSLVRAAVETL